MNFLKRPYDLPPMSSLVSFEAAARHVSFKSAARELNVTPAAISHQVKALETDLQCALFHRHHRGVELTETGAYLLVALQRGFEAMQDAVDQLKARRARTSVTIRATTAVSYLWLTPKLAQFWKTHGDISVAQIINDTDPAQSECDLSIDYGRTEQGNGTSSPLFQDRIMALASPRFAAKHQVRRAEDLAKLPLIHLDTAMLGWTNWPDWLHAQGYAGPIGTGHRVNNYMIALQAAKDDMGAVLGWVGLTRDFLDKGDLVPLLPDQVTPAEHFHVRLHSAGSDRARLVYDWLVAAP